MGVTNETLKRAYMDLALKELLRGGKIVLFTPSTGEVQVTGIKAVTNLAALIADNAVKAFRAAPADLVKLEPSIPMPQLTTASGIAIAP